ncbi:3-hydroxylacyl-ACP dehydratase [Pelomonas sp. KK5]|uniref:ApeP family dehydratase n=1 Tax=Pelomonas sp. KK5 TaxID=1855730 RepID=UPI00097C2FAF|nr:3-hydroxylacyl-ACP dehydratase [Pelomonas sp. KK5]
MNPIASLVPHAGRMSLLQTVLDCDAESLRAELTVSEGDLFFHEGVGIGGWVGIEYMAQAVAAWAGAQGGEPRIGFLLGSRRYRCSRSAFRAGEKLSVSVRREFQADNGLGQFDCRIEIGEDCVATAQLTVFGPEDPVAFLTGESKTNE